MGYIQNRSVIKWEIEGVNAIVVVQLSPFIVLYVFYSFLFDFKAEIKRGIEIA